MEEYEKYACSACGQVPDIDETFKNIKATMEEIKNLDVRIRGMASLSAPGVNPAAMAMLVVSKFETEQYLHYLLNEELPIEVSLILGPGSYPPPVRSKPQPTAPAQQD